MRPDLLTSDVVVDGHFDSLHPTRASDRVLSRASTFNLHKRQQDAARRQRQDTFPVMSAPMVVSETQKVWLQVTKGTPQNGMQLRTDWRVPKVVPPGKVLVKIQAAALNPVYLSSVVAHFLLCD